jgi:hypothetical protein
VKTMVMTTAGSNHIVPSLLASLAAIFLVHPYR